MNAELPLWAAGVILGWAGGCCLGLWFAYLYTRKYLKDRKVR